MPSDNAVHRFVRVRRNPHVTSVTGEKFDLWKTGWSLFVQIPKDIQPELVPGLLVAENVVPYDGDKCASSILQNVQISGLLDDGHEVLVRTGHLNGATPFGASFDGGEFKPIDAPSGSEIYTCPDLDVQESTLDDCNSEPVGTPALRSSGVRATRTKHVTLSKDNMNKRLGVQIRQHRDRLEVKEVGEGLISRWNEDHPERTFEETVNVPVPRVMEETVEAVKHVPQEHVQSNTVDQIVAVPVPRIREETGQVIQRIPQDRISDRSGEQVIDIFIRHIQEKLVGMIHLILQERISERSGAELALRIQEELLQTYERIVETFMEVPVPQIQERSVEGTTSTSTPTLFAQRKPLKTSLWEKTLCTLHLSSARDHLQSLGSGRHPSRRRTLGVVLSVSNVARSLTGKCPVSRLSVEETMFSTLSSPKQVPDKGIHTAERYQDEDETNKAKVEAKKQAVAEEKTQRREQHDVRLLEAALPGAMEAVTKAESTIDSVAVVAGSLVADAGEEMSDSVETTIKETEVAAAEAHSAIQVSRKQVTQRISEAKAFALDVRRVASAEYASPRQDRSCASCEATPSSHHSNHADCGGNASGQFLDRVVDVPVVMQRHVPTIQKVQKTVEVLQVQFIDKLVDDPTVMQRPMSTSQGAQHHVDISASMERLTLATQIADGPCHFAISEDNSDELNEPADEEDHSGSDQGGWLECENKKRRIPNQSETVFEGPSMECKGSEGSDPKRFEDLVLFYSQSRRTDEDEPLDEAEKEQAMDNLV